MIQIVITSHFRWISVNSFTGISDGISNHPSDIDNRVSLWGDHCPSSTFTDRGASQSEIFSGRKRGGCLRGRESGEEGEGREEGRFGGGGGGGGVERGRGRGSVRERQGERERQMKWRIEQYTCTM